MINEIYYENSILGKYDLRYPTVPGGRIYPYPADLYSIVEKMEKRLEEKLLAENRVYD
jgi:hypothetical protein